MPMGLFWFLAVVTVIASLGVILQRNPVHCLLSLVVTLLAIAVIFIGEDAVVVGFLQAIVYAGAIMVLFLFVIWLLNIGADTGPSGHLALKFFGGVAAAALIAELLIFLLPPHLKVKFAGHSATYGSIESLARTLFSQYIVAFEITSILLLIAIVGAVALARRGPGSQLAKSASGSAPAERVL